MRVIFYLTLIVCVNSLFLFAQGKSPNDFDVIIKGGTIYDGTGGSPYKADVGIKGDVVIKIGNLSKAKAAQVVDGAAFDKDVKIVLVD